MSAEPNRTPPAVRGIVPVVVTPLTREGRLDEAGLYRLLEFLLEQEVGGLWVLGTGSEDMNLPFATRLRVAQITTAVAAGRVPLLVGTAFFAWDDILAFLEATAHLPLDAYHVMPYHPLLSFRQLEEFYARLAEVCPRPLLAYTSANWSIPFTPEFVARLKEIPNLAGIKYSTTRMVDVLAVTALGEDDFQVITAVAGQTYPCFCAGAHAHTSSLASALPEPLIEIYRLFRQGEHRRALEAQWRLNRFLAAIRGLAKKDNFLQAAEEKYILHLRGLCQPYTSSYYRDLSELEMRLLESKLAEFGYHRYLEPVPQGRLKEI